MRVRKCVSAERKSATYPKQTEMACRVHWNAAIFSKHLVRVHFGVCGGWVLKLFFCCCVFWTVQIKCLNKFVVVFIAFFNFNCTLRRRIVKLYVCKVYVFVCKSTVLECSNKIRTREMSHRKRCVEATIASKSKTFDRICNDKTKANK